MFMGLFTRALQLLIMESNLLSGRLRPMFPESGRERTLRQGWKVSPGLSMVSHSQTFQFDLTSDGLEDKPWSATRQRSCNYATQVGKGTGCFLHRGLPSPSNLYATCTPLSEVHGPTNFSALGLPDAAQLLLSFCTAGLSSSQLPTDHPPLLHLS